MDNSKERSNNKKGKIFGKLFFIFLIGIIIWFFYNNLINSKVSEEQIKKDIISLDPNFQDCGLEIDFLEISERRNVKNESDNIELVVHSSNDEGTYQENFILDYNKYSDGWILDDYQMWRSIAEPKVECRENVAYAFLLEDEREEYSFSDIRYVDQPYSDYENNFEGIYDYKTYRYSLNMTYYGKTREFKADVTCTFIGKWIGHDVVYIDVETGDKIDNLDDPWLQYLFEKYN